MRYLLLLLFTCSLALSTKAQPRKKLLNDTIIWRSDYLLVREDFKAKVKPGSGGHATSAIYLYPKEVDGIYLYYIEAILIKSKSALMADSKYTLNHEQKHFDITEVHARKLRKKLSETNFLKVNNSGKKINDIYGDIYKDYNKEQEKYDKETEHGINMARQNFWDERIAKELEELAAYSEIEVNIVKK